MDFKSLNKKVENDILNIAKPSVLFFELEGSKYTEHFVTVDEVL